MFRFSRFNFIDARRGGRDSTEERERVQQLYAGIAGKNGLAKIEVKMRAEIDAPFLPFFLPFLFFSLSVCTDYNVLPVLLRSAVAARHAAIVIEVRHYSPDPGDFGYFSKAKFDERRIMALA